MASSTPGGKGAPSTVGSSPHRRRLYIVDIRDQQPYITLADGGVSGETRGSTSKVGGENARSTSVYGGQSGSLRDGSVPDRHQRDSQPRRLARVSGRGDRGAGRVEPGRL